MSAEDIPLTVPLPPEYEETLFALENITAKCKKEACEWSATGNLFVFRRNYMTLYDGVLRFCRLHHLEFPMKNSHNAFALLRGEEEIGHSLVSSGSQAGMVFPDLFE